MASNAAAPPRFAELVYRWRFALSALSLALVALCFGSGAQRVLGFTADMHSLGDTTNGAGDLAPLVFDPRMDVWFGPDDLAVQTYREIEERFVAEDYIMVTFEARDDAYGVFGTEALSAIARLTERMLEVPGVRHVRSLTSNPWIRWDEIEPGEEGLVISDLVEGAAADLTEDERLVRMIAVLGAERVASRFGQARVRAALGPDAVLEDHIGEPLLLGTILDETGMTTAIQVQVLRPRVDEQKLASVFDSAEKRAVARAMYSVQAQRSSLLGVEHVLRQELGLAVPTPGLATLEEWVAGLPDGNQKSALAFELANPNRNFMSGPDGALVRKYFEYVPDGAGGWVDRSNPSEVISAPADFRPQPSSSFEYHLGGVPLFERNFEDVGKADSKYMALMFLMIVVMLAAVFRDAFGVVVPLMVVVCAVMMTVGLTFATGKLLNNMTLITPNVLTAVGLADAIHLLASWAKLRGAYTDRRELILEVIRRNALPVFLTSVTTAVGFYSLTVSSMLPVKMFGAMAGLGTLMAYLLSMSIVPAMLSLAPHPPRSTRSSLQGFTGWEAGLARRVLRSRVPILVTSGLLLAVSVVGLCKLEVNSDFRGMFPASNPVISDFNWIEDRMGGVGDLEIVFKGPAAEGPDTAFTAEEQEELAALRLEVALHAAGHAAAPARSAKARRAVLEERERGWEAGRIAVSAEFLEEVDRFETRLREEMARPDSPLHIVSDLLSPLDILRRMNQVQNEARGSSYRVPDSTDIPPEVRTPSLSYDEWTDEWLMIPAQDASTLAAQYYLQYENGARPGENLSTQISLDRTQFRMQGRIVQAQSEVTMAAVRAIEQIAASEFPMLGARASAWRELGKGAADMDSTLSPGIDMQVSGKMVLFARTNRIFTIGFIQSMSIALATITLLIALIFRSLRMALVSLIPNVLPIMMPLSVFGLLGRPLDSPAIFVSSVALGVCVDDTLHFFTKFLRARRDGKGMEDSIRYVFETTGTAITVTSVVLVLGFATLVLSDFAPNTMMGTLAAAMITLAWVADIVVTPAALSVILPERLHPTAQTDTLRGSASATA